MPAGAVQLSGMPELPAFAQDALEDLQNGRIPNAPPLLPVPPGVVPDEQASSGPEEYVQPPFPSPAMDIIPFTNGTSVASGSTSTSTSLTLPGGGVVHIEHSVSLGHTIGGTDLPPPALQTTTIISTLSKPSVTPTRSCAPKPEPVTSTITVTQGAGRCGASQSIVVLTETKIVVETRTRTISPGSAATTALSPRPPPKPATTRKTTAYTTSRWTSSATVSHSSLSSASTAKPPVAAPPSSSAKPPPPAPSKPSSNTFEGQVLTAHNEWRAKYGAGPLVWDAALASQADAWAARCEWDHGPGASNLDSAANSEGTAKLDGAAVLEHWISGPNEASSYNPDAPVGSHFTQAVWKGATKVGCVVTTCNLAIYDPSWWPAALAVCYYDTGELPRGPHEGFLNIADY